VEIGGKHNFSLSHSALKLGSNNPQQQSPQEDILKLENYKACCCDERCESVETPETPMPHTVYEVELQVAFCENRGKQSPYWRVSREI